MGLALVFRLVGYHISNWQGKVFKVQNKELYNKKFISMMSKQTNNSHCGTKGIPTKMLLEK